MLSALQRERHLEGQIQAKLCADPLWNVMFLSKGITLLSGVRRRRDIMFRQTGKRMKMTSMCRTWAEPRAAAKRQ